MPASSSTSTIILAVALAFACALVIFFLVRKPKAAPDPSAEKPVREKEVPERDLEAEYLLGLDPCASGRNVMYTLKTCLHCVHLKQFLDKHGIECMLVYVDDFEDERRRELMAKVRSFNPRGSYPTLVLPDGRVVVGYRENKVRELFGLTS